jgi:hypothetical protein
MTARHGMSRIGPCPILMYHNIASAPRACAAGAACTSVRARSRGRCGCCKRFGYTGLSMSDAMPYLRGERKGRIAVITLDDGYADNLQSAMPVLQRYGFSATCYVVSGSIGRLQQVGCRAPGYRRSR